MENAVLLCGTDLRRQERRRADEVVQLSTNKDPDWSGLESTSARLGMKRVEAEVCRQAVPGRRTCPFITTILRVDMLTNIRKAAVVDRDVTAVHRMTVSRMRRTRGLLPRSTPYTAPQRDIVEPAKMEYGKFMYRGRRLNPETSGKHAGSAIWRTSGGPLRFKATRWKHQSYHSGPEYAHGDERQALGLWVVASVPAPRRRQCAALQHRARCFHLA